MCKPSRVPAPIPGFSRKPASAAAQILLAVTNSDETNLIACIFANLLAPNIQKVVRIRNEEYDDYRESLARDILNIGLVTNPDLEVINSVMRLITTPQVEEVRDFAGGRIRLVRKQLPPDSPINGLKLMELPSVMRNIRMVVAAIIREDRLIIPTGQDKMQGGDVIYFVCEKAGELMSIIKLFGTPGAPGPKTVLIVGGGKIGLRLAQELEKLPYN
jgi:trk system potassium uptake protein